MGWLCPFPKPTFCLPLRAMSAYLIIVGVKTSWLITRRIILNPSHLLPIAIRVLQT